MSWLSWQGFSSSVSSGRSGLGSEMPALGILLLVAGFVAIRQVIVGRVKETPGDVSDAATSLLSGDTAGFAAVMSRRGSNTDAVAGSTSVGLGSEPATALPSSGATTLASECVALGSAAKGYRSGATGPDYYDCSGLVWKAAYTLGIYKGPRFTTFTFEHIAGGFAKQVSTPQSGDIIVWVAGKHMGVMVSDTDFYSARNEAKGIGSAPLSADVKYFGAEPDIWRVG